MRPWKYTDLSLKILKIDSLEIFLFFCFIVTNKKFHEKYSIFCKYFVSNNMYIINNTWYK